jgi:TRAP-type C4-dicarboxylate transport system permease small subunit
LRSRRRRRDPAVRGRARSSATRATFHRPLVWADELASTLFVWLSALGAVLATRRNAHMRLTTFISRAAPALRQQI